MKFTLSWLKQHLETDAPLDRITERLTALGLEVEGVEDRAAALASFVIARVKSAVQHPNADRLRVCIVDTGSGETQVVCGAPNARTGMIGVFAAPGSFIPGTKVKLEAGMIRGQASNGMLLSERELGLSDEHAGIIDLPADAPIGQPFVTYKGWDDPVIEINLTPDRPDCAGVRGIARDLAAAGLGQLKPIDTSPVPPAFKSPIGVRLDLPADVAEACPLYLGRLIRGVRNRPSPASLAERLTAVGLRPISTLVDITNLLTLDQARPLHVFDAAKLKGDVVVRLSRPGERLDALNDKSYVLADDQVTCITDDSGVIGLGGVIGGVSTGVTESTRDVFIECALFDPRRTAATGRKLGIQSDARYRFERGVDPDAVFDGIEQATRLILELCGGSPSEVVVAGKVPEWRRQIRLRPTRVATLGGVAVEPGIQAQALTALGFTVAPQPDDTMLVDRPSWRPDVEGEADLVEEVLRLEGFDRIPATPLPRLAAMTRPALTPRQRTAALIRRALAARGLDEAVTWSFMASEVAGWFGFQHAGLKLLNPIAADLDVMRPSILGNLIQAAGRNAARSLPDSALFEVGPVYRDPSENGQRQVAAGIRSGNANPRHWSGPARPVDAFEAKADALAVLEAAGAPIANLQITTDAPDWFHPGRSAALRLGAAVLAQFGEIHPAVLTALGVSGPVVGFEVFLDAVPAPRARKTAARPPLTLSPLQPVERDFAFIVDEAVAADRLLRAARSADKALIADAGIFDLYRGPGLPQGRKSIALWVRLQPTQATLTDAEIEAIGQRIVAAVEKQTGATLRR